MALRTENETDSKNAGQADYERKFQDIKKAEENLAFDENTNSSSEGGDGGIQGVKNSEDSAGNGQWVNNVASRTVDGKSQKTLGRFNLRKKGPIASIIAIIVGGGGGMFLLFSPGLAVIQMSEVFMGDLDDITAGLDLRKDSILRSRMKGLNVGICSSKISIGCKFSSMSKRQINKFKKAGIEIDCGSGGCDSRLRNRVVAFTFPDGSKLDNPNNLRSFMRSNPAAMSAMSKAFNTKFIALSSNAAKKVFNRFGISKARTIKGSTTGQIKDSLNNRVNGKKNGVSVTLESPADPDSGSNERTRTQVALDNVRSSRGFGGAVKGVGIVGHLDQACTVYQTSRSLSLLSQIIRHQRLIVFAASMLTAASALKAGVETPEVAEYVGNKLTEVDMREYLGTSDEVDLNGNPVDPEPIPNPGYKKSAMNSPLWNLSQFGDVPNMSAIGTSISSFTVGGAGAGILKQIYEDARNTLGGSPRAQCGVVQNNIVRGASLIVGILASLTPVGAVKLVGGVVGGMVVLNIALGYLEDMIRAEAEDIDIDSLARYGDFSAAMFTGTSGLYGQTAQASGATPLTSETLPQYMAQRESVNNDYIAMETYEAKNEPLNIYNQYSFLGSAARSLLNMTGSNKSALFNLSSIVSGSLKSLLPTSKANNAFNPDRFEICDEENYQELDIKADVMCNVRYGFSDFELNLESDEVYSFMNNKGYINDNAPEEADIERVAMPGTDYSRFLEYCAFREVPFGEQGIEGESKWDTGENCLGKGSGGDIDSQIISYFKVFTADYTLIQAMDYELEPFGEPEKAAFTPIDMDSLFKDSSSISCPSGTEEVRNDTGYRSGQAIPIKLCGLQNTIDRGKDAPALANSRVAGAASAMFEQMRRDLEIPTVSLNDSFRTMAEQQSAWNQYGSPRAARPGYSNHQMGIAFDIDMGPRNGGTSQKGLGISTDPGNPVWEWLNNNAAAYGFKQLSNETWHWSPTGG